MRIRFPGAGMALSAVAVACLHPTAMRAQEASFLIVRAASSNPELPAPAGFALAAHVEAESWLLSLGFVRYHDRTRKEGVVCRVYSPRIDCGAEEVEASTVLSGLRFEALRALYLGDVARIGVGGGVSFNSVTGSADGVSGRRADFYLPNDGQIGYLGRVSVAVKPWPGIPIRLTGSYAAHWVRFKGCSNPEDPTSGYDPFCGMDRFREISVGVALDLAGLRGG